MRPVFKKITVDKSVRDTSIARKFPDAEIVSEAPNTSDTREGKKRLHISPKSNRAFDLCATFNRKYICCNFHVLRSVSNCPYECSYCFLQNYLNNHTASVVADTEGLIEEVKEAASREPDRLFRVGTWELGDSLGLEPETGAAAELIKGFSQIQNALLELRTKSCCVDSVLNLDHRKHTVIGFSMNPSQVISSEESGTATLEERLAAIEKVAKANYLISIHLDPLILCDNWREAYDDLVKRIFEVAPIRQIAWISVSSLRFESDMKMTIEKNFPDSRLTLAELVLGDDGKYRYVKPLRVEMYKFVYEKIRRYGGSGCFVYLCMERWDIWEKVFGSSPESPEDLESMITEALRP